MAKTQIKIDELAINIKQVNEEDYISLTDMSNWDGDPNARARIGGWLKNRNTIEFLSIWEQAFNPNFNYSQMTVIKTEIGLNSFTMTAKKWIEQTGAIGIVSKAGRYGGTYAHKYIAFEFASWLSAEFKFRVAVEFDRLKAEEYNRLAKEWSFQRYLTKVNHSLHTGALRDEVIKKLGIKKDRQFEVYASEADMLNVIVFGCTAKEWRDAKPAQALSGNMRDYASTLELIVLSNMESLNSNLVKRGVTAQDRFEILKIEAGSQFKSLSERKDIQYLDKRN